VAPTVGDVIARIEAWRGRAPVVRPLTNGLTNANYRVDVGGESYVVRIPGESTELLGIDRENELHNARVAAGLGIGPRIVHHLPDVGATVVEFLHGRPLTNDDLRAPGMPGRIAATVRRLHAGPRFLRDFDMLRLADRYRALAARRGFPLPDTFPARRAAIGRMEAGLGVNPPATVPCHNDLLADNYIEQDGRLRLLDWEYSGNGDPAFELGDTACELEYDAPRVAELCRAYFGVESPAAVARVHLQAIAADVGWALWAAIQTAISRIAFDFRAYGDARWRRAEAAMDSRDFPGWLDAVRRPIGS